MQDKIGVLIYCGPDGTKYYLIGKEGDLEGKLHQAKLQFFAIMDFLALNSMPMLSRLAMPSVLPGGAPVQELKGDNNAKKLKIAEEAGEIWAVDIDSDARWQIDLKDL